MSLTEAQNRIKAQTKVEKLALDEKLSNLDVKITQIFKDVSINVADAISKEELKELISEIIKGTATNTKISRFLEIAETIGF